MKIFLFIVAALLVGCSSPADNLANCPSTDGIAGEFTCTPATYFASRAATTLLIEETEFRPYYDLFLLAVTAEPLLGRTRVRLPYGLDGKMRTQVDAIGKMWAKNSFHTSESGFNDLVAKLRLTPNVGTFELQVEGTVQFYTIYPNVTSATPMYSNKLVGEAFAAVEVFLQPDESNAFPGDDSTWTWIADNQARIVIGAMVGNCFDGNGCGIHNFEADVSLAGATVYDKGGFVPIGGLDLAPNTIRQRN